jgi:hypothetical protein
LLAVNGFDGTARKAIEVTDGHWQGEQIHFRYLQNVFGGMVGLPRKCLAAKQKSVARNAIRKTSLPSLGHVNPTKGADLRTPSFRLCRFSQSA